MTDERKNEIWAMLDADAKMAMSRLWHNTSSERDETKLLEMLFGKHNLTAQAEEKPSDKSEMSDPSESDRLDPKRPVFFHLTPQNTPNPPVSQPETTQKIPSEPRFKVGDKVLCFGQDATIFKVHDNGYDVKFGGGEAMYDLPKDVFSTYPKPKGESNINEENGSTTPMTLGPGSGRLINSTLI